MMAIVMQLAFDCYLRGVFVVQTGDQVKQMAAGAVETVKNTLGVGDRSNSSRN